MLQAIYIRLYLLLRSLLRIQSDITAITSDIDDLNALNWDFRDWDDSSDPLYAGYLNPQGSWRIEEINETNGTIRVALGDDNYATNWTNRAALDYDY